MKKKAATVAKCVGLYTSLEIPCAIYLGMGLDGFTLLDETGRGNPWGLKASDIEAYRANGTLPPGRRVFTCGGKTKEVELSSRGEAVAKPGFGCEQIV